MGTTSDRIHDIVYFWTKALVRKWLRRLRQRYKQGRMQKNIKLYVSKQTEAAFYGAILSLGKQKRHYGVVVSAEPYAIANDVNYAPKKSKRARSFFFTEGFYNDVSRISAYVRNILLSDAENQEVIVHNEDLDLGYASGEICNSVTAELLQRWNA